METRYKLNDKGLGRIGAKYAESKDVKSIFKPVLFAAVFFLVLAAASFTFYVLLLAGVAVCSFFAEMLRSNRRIRLENAVYTITVHRLIEAKYCYDEEDNRDSYRLYCESSGYLLFQSWLYVSKDDYIRYSKQIGEPIYILHIGGKEHLVHFEELRMN